MHINVYIYICTYNIYNMYIYIHRFYRLLGCTSSFHTRPESWELMILGGFFSAARGILEVRGSHAEKEDLYHDISSIYYFNSFKTQCYCVLMISDDPWFASQFPIFSDLGWLGWSKADGLPPFTTFRGATGWCSRAATQPFLANPCKCRQVSSLEIHGSRNEALVLDDVHLQVPSDIFNIAMEHFPFLMGKSTIFNSYVSLPEGKFKVPQSMLGPSTFILQLPRVFDLCLDLHDWYLKMGYTMIYRLYPPQF